MKEETAILVREPSAVAVRQTSDAESLMELAINKGADVGALERLMVMRQQLKQERAKESFIAAMASFQNECPPITKLKAGAKDSYKYAPLDAIVAVVKPLLVLHGFSYSITSDIEPNWVKAICTVTHREGHSEKSEFKVPIDSRNPMMNDPQRYGGSMTFSKRYAFVNAFGILTADEDLDGRTTRQKPAGPSSMAAGDIAVDGLRKELWELLKPVRGAEQNWKQANQWLWDESVIRDTEEAPKFTAVRFQEVINKAKGKIK